MHFSLGTTQRGIIGGWAVAEIAALAAALQADTTHWRYVIGGMILICGAPVGALIDPGRAVEKPGP